MIDEPSFDSSTTPESLNSGTPQINREQPTQTELPAPPSRSKRILKRIGWTLLGLGLLITFTLSKIPEDRIQNFVQGTLNSILAEQGISISAGQTSFSVIFGLAYTMKDVTLRPNPPAQPIHLDEMGFSPSILPMIFGKNAGKFWIDNAGGELDGRVSVKNSEFSFQFNAKNLDLKKLGLVEALWKFKAGAVINGKGRVSGDASNPPTIDGDIDLSIKQLQVEPQTFMGFSIPKLSISDSQAHLVIEKGKGTIQAFRIGKAGDPADDIHANLTGSVNLGRQINASVIDVRAQFDFSQTVMKSFALLDAILGAGKQAKGGYAFRLTGPLYAPIPAPIPAGQ